mmetsp:Transcript_17569/g.44234  ORF Transcript_17569/g.44234 Transcript_17569/m.44234 type:complete len:349 (+) Transcript_17569:1240-2286(+)
MLSADQLVLVALSGAAAGDAGCADAAAAGMDAAESADAGTSGAEVRLCGPASRTPARLSSTADADLGMGPAAGGMGPTTPTACASLVGVCTGEHAALSTGGRGTCGWLGARGAAPCADTRRPSVPPSLEGTVGSEERLRPAMTFGSDERRRAVRSRGVSPPCFMDALLLAALEGAHALPAAPCTSHSLLAGWGCAIAAPAVPGPLLSVESGEMSVRVLYMWPLACAGSHPPDLSDEPPPAGVTPPVDARCCAANPATECGTVAMVWVRAAPLPAAEPGTAAPSALLSCASALLISCLMCCASRHRSPSCALSACSPSSLCSAACLACSTSSAARASDSARRFHLKYAS